MKWLFYVIVFVYMFYRAVYGKSEGLLIDPIKYDEEGYIIAGELLSINCKPFSKSQNVEWLYPNGKEVKRILGNRIYAQEHYVSGSRRNPALVLTITKTEVQDSGVYKCHSGDITKEVSLCVIDPPKFLDSNTEYVADVGRSITLSCQVKGDPEPRLVWTRNGEAIIDEDSEKYKVMMKYNIQTFEGLLTITSLEPEDSGVYSCLSFQNNPRAGHNCTVMSTLNITLNVNFPPTFEGTNETNVYAMNNEEVEITCAAAGFPAPTYRFFKVMENSLLEFDNKQIKYSEDNSEAVLTVVASSSTLEQTFKCQATNDQGSNEKYFTLLKTERPTKIDEVTPEPSDKSIKFHVKWTDEVLFPITGFDIQYIKDSYANKKKYLREPTWRKSPQTQAEYGDDDSSITKFGGTVVLPNLDEETSYWVRLRATNDVGVSPWSDPIFVETLAEGDVPTTTEAETESSSGDPESSDLNTAEPSDATFYGIFFAGGIFVVAFVCMFALRLVKT